MSSHYQAISHIDNQNVQFILRCSESAANNVTKTHSNRWREAERMFQFIDGLCITVTFFQLLNVLLVLVKQYPKIIKSGE